MAVQNGDIVKVAMEVTLNDGTIAQNVYHFRAALPSPEGDASVVAGIETWLEGAYSELSSELVNTITQNSCPVDIVEWNATEGIWETTYHVGDCDPTIGFNNINEALPNMTAALCTLNTARPKSRGRKFLFPFGEDVAGNSYLTGAALANMADYATRILVAINFGIAADLIPGIVRATEDTFLDYAVAIVTNVLATQRRRRPGVGA